MPQDLLDGFGPRSAGLRHLGQWVWLMTWVQDVGWALMVQNRCQQSGNTAVTGHFLHRKHTHKHCTLSSSTQPKRRVFPPLVSLSLSLSRSLAFPHSIDDGGDVHDNDDDDGLDDDDDVDDDDDDDDDGDGVE